MRIIAINELNELCLYRNSSIVLDRWHRKASGRGQQPDKSLQRRNKSYVSEIDSIAYRHDM